MSQAAGARRFATWRDAQVRQGAARAYPHAWRLPQAARALGGAAPRHAAIALGLTLFQLGRYHEALATLPRTADDDDDAGPDLAPIFAVLLPATRAACLHVLGDEAQATALAASAPLRVATPVVNAVRVALAFMRNAPDDLPTATGGYPADTTPPAWAAVADACVTIGRHWHAARHGNDDTFPAARAALTVLSQHMPAAGALAEAMLAEAHASIRPDTALVWLDEALRQCEGYGQHHLRARLLAGKSKALLAGGQLAEAERFGRLAEALARQQGLGRCAWQGQADGTPADGILARPGAA